MQAQKRTVEDYFGKWIEDEGQLELASLLEVQEIRVKRQERVMCIQTKTSHLFSPVWCNTLQGAIQEGMQDQLRVSLEVQYKPKNQEDIWEDAWDMALDTERHLHPMLVSILSSPKRSACRAGQVEIKLPASQARLLRHSGILQRLEADMRQITGSHTQIHLQEEAETPDLIQQQEEERKKREESILRKMLAQNVPAPEEQMEPQSQAMVEPGELPWDDPVDNWGSGMPEMDEHGQPVYRMTPERFAVSMKELIGLGANLVGGCCGTAPEYIRSLAEAAGLT